MLFSRVMSSGMRSWGWETGVWINGGDEVWQRTDSRILGLKTKEGENLGDMTTIRTRIIFTSLATAGAIAAVAIGAVSASAELAPLSKFVATPRIGKTLPAKVKGEGVGPQVWKFKGLEIVCQRAKVTGEVSSAESETLELTISYKECTGGPVYVGGKGGAVGYPKEHFREKAELTYHYAGWLESAEEVEMVMKGLKCITDWEGETYPEKAEEHPANLYQDAKFQTQEVPNANERLFPSGMQKKILITNEVKGKGLEWEGEGEGVCEEFEFFPEGEKGKYSGKLLVEVPSGNLEFKEPI